MRPVCLVGTVLILLMAASCEADTAPNLPVGQIVVDDLTLEVWIADESPERRQGLRGVEALPAGVDGMLFVLPIPTATSFNMSDTPIPLDIWWFDAEMTLIGSSEMEPCPADPCVSYGAPGPIAWALETPAGVWEFSDGAALTIVESG